MQSLYTSNYKAHKQRVPVAVDGTCKWFFQHEKYVNWINALEPGILWVTADPACGKSVLASFLIDHLSKVQAQPEGQTTICFFFFKDDNDQQRHQRLL